MILVGSPERREAEIAHSSSSQHQPALSLNDDFAGDEAGLGARRARHPGGDDEDAGEASHDHHIGSGRTGRASSSLLARALSSASFIHWTTEARRRNRSKTSLRSLAERASFGGNSM